MIFLAFERRCSRQPDCIEALSFRRAYETSLTILLQGLHHKPCQDRWTHW
jgi:hypothetical protein